MSFGFSPGDVVLLVQLAWKTVQNSRKACGEHAELTRETTSLHVNLQRLARETAKPESPINRPSDTCKQDLAPIVEGCGKALDVLDKILEKYNALGDEERSKGKLWKAVRFGNRDLANVKDLRLKLTYYTSNLSLFLNMVSLGSMGIVEKRMYEAGGDLKDIRRAVNDITSHLKSGTNREGSVMTDYADDKAVWRAFRRELVKEGFSSDVIRKHKDTIQAYVKKLGSRDRLDDEDLKDSGNVPEELEDTEPAQTLRQSRDEAMGSFEIKSGAARDAASPRTATTAHVDSIFGTGKRDPRENGTFSPQTQIPPAPLRMNNVSNTLPSTPQTNAKINGVVKSDSREVKKVNDRKNRHRSSAPIPLAPSPTKLAQDSRSSGGRMFVPTCRYYNFDYGNRVFLSSAKHEQEFEFLSNSPLYRGEILEIQTKAKGFLKVAELRIRLRNLCSKPDRKALLKVAPMLEKWHPFVTDRLSGVIINGLPSTIINDLKQWGLCWINARPENWRIRKWPSS